MLFLRNSPTGQTRQRIFTHDGSNYADSRKNVPFLGIFHIAPHLGGQKPQKLIILGREYAFSSQTREIEKRAYYQNYCIDSNQILHSDKDHQMPFVGGPHTRVTNPRWRTAAILEKWKNCYISAAVRAILTKFGKMLQFDPFKRSDR